MQMFIKRGVAYLIDAIIAVMPALVMYFAFAGGIDKTMAPLYYPAPIIGTVAMADLPGIVNDEVNLVTSDEGGVIATSNHSMTATGMRMLSVLVIVFYIAYSAFCTAMYEGRTVGKKLMRLKVVPMDETKDEKGRIKCYLLREVLGKVIINSTVVAPLLSVVMALVMPGKRTIHDFIGGTKVVIDEAAEDEE